MKSSPRYSKGGQYQQIMPNQKTIEVRFIVLKIRFTDITLSYETLTLFHVSFCAEKHLANLRTATKAQSFIVSVIILFFRFIENSGAWWLDRENWEISNCFQSTHTIHNWAGTGGNTTSRKTREEDSNFDTVEQRNGWPWQDSDILVCRKLPNKGFTLFLYFL